jgi:ABC-type phosphate/phosphonate transport system permease subunit
MLLQHISQSCLSTHLSSIWVFIFMFSLDQKKSSKQSFQSSANKVSWYYRNIVFVSVFFVVISTCVYAISSLRFTLITSNLSRSSQSFHPTSIPWLTNKADCEHNLSRVWREGHCWDYEHNPSF